MFYSILATVLVFSCGVTFVGTELAEQPDDKVQTQKFKTPSKAFLPVKDSWEINPNLNSMWSYRPESVQSQYPSEPLTRKILLKTPLALTRLAKSLKIGYDPYFDKGLFEPFERRQKPVNVINFRKNGLLPRTDPETSTVHANKFAELQSPYNEVSSFWQDEEGLFRVNV